MKPLFIPLKTEFFEAFALGEKTVEYRKHGPRWNAETCAIGREVVIRKGYGKIDRIRGVITGFWVDRNPTNLPGWTECYGVHPGDAAVCIQIEVQP